MIMIYTEKLSDACASANSLCRRSLVSLLALLGSCTNLTRLGWRWGRSLLCRLALRGFLIGTWCTCGAITSRLNISATVFLLCFCRGRLLMLVNWGTPRRLLDSEGLGNWCLKKRRPLLLRLLVVSCKRCKHSTESLGWCLGHHQVGVRIIV